MSKFKIRKAVPQPARFRFLDLGLRIFFGSWISVFGFLTGCRHASSAPKQEVTLYTSIDEPVARPIINAFEKQTGIHVNLVLDSEASKTAGLSARLEAERDHPQADVWWSNEPFHTINLADAGVLTVYASREAGAIDPQYKDPQRKWAGVGLRLRVLAVAPGAEGKVNNLTDLAKPEFRGKIAMSQPAIGTVGGHVAAIYQLLGDDKADAFFRSLKDNGLHIVNGNSVVADSVGQGAFLAGITDNDDVDNAIREGGKLKAVYPDQQDDGLGTLAIPSTVGLVAGAPHVEPARKLIDFLLSIDTERRLISSHFAEYDVHGGVPNDPDVHLPRYMKIDYIKTARAMPAAITRAKAILAAP
jgi:iron(III) transport system substrate-binding protein